ncbi:hypothetical protein ACFXJ8_39150 [Nonomuraea sp. NPDC059194]|uniref:hypothetical protein n=1 Tax=Nonomuraea sp. NPDC059194 TaxID=3346764 RepID=UPI0036B1CC2E
MGVNPSYDKLRVLSKGLPVQLSKATLTAVLKGTNRVGPPKWDKVVSYLRAVDRYQEEMGLRPVAGCLEEWRERYVALQAQDARRKAERLRAQAQPTVEEKAPVTDSVDLSAVQTVPTSQTHVAPTYRPEPTFTLSAGVGFFFREDATDDMPSYAWLASPYSKGPTFALATSPNPPPSPTVESAAPEGALSKAELPHNLGVPSSTTISVPADWAQWTDASCELEFFEPGDRIFLSDWDPNATDSSGVWDDLVQPVEKEATMAVLTRQGTGHRTVDRMTEWFGPRGTQLAYDADADDPLATFELGILLVNWGSISEGGELLRRAGQLDERLVLETGLFRPNDLLYGKVVQHVFSRVASEYEAAGLLQKADRWDRIARSYAGTKEAIALLAAPSGRHACVAQHVSLDPVQVSSIKSVYWRSYALNPDDTRFTLRDKNLLNDMLDDETKGSDHATVGLPRTVVDSVLDDFHEVLRKGYPVRLHVAAMPTETVILVPQMA